MSELVERVIRGVGVAPGIGHGPCHVLGAIEEDVPSRSVAESEVPGEIARLERALTGTRAQILEIQDRVAIELGSTDAGIFDAHLLFLEDRTLLEEVIRRLREERRNVEAVFRDVWKRYAQALSQVEDRYLRERSADIRDVGRRVLRNLLGRETEDLRRFGEPGVVVAHDIAPSMAVSVDRAHVAGFATDMGSATSHVAIIAASLGIPAVVALHDASREVASGQPALLDGYRGLLIVNPSRETLQRYERLERRTRTVDETLAGLRDLPAETVDGRRVVLSANIETPSEVESVLEQGAEGVGLYRTEYLFMDRSILPSEDVQFQAYDSVAARLAPRPLIIRTLDVGGDKFLWGSDYTEERNPFLGWRGIRISLDRPEVFKVQLRAILRASARGNVSVMFPMISSAEEVHGARRALDECRDELDREGTPYDAGLQVGVMIEVPSVALTADLLAPEVDFFSVGTNDLVQYTLAVDRNNERIAHLYRPTHPAVLRLLSGVVRAGHDAGIWVGVCGQMAGELSLAPLLLGLGVDELSVGPFAVPRVKKIIRALRMAEAQEAARDALAVESADAVERIAVDLLRRVAPEVSDELMNGEQETGPIPSGPVKKDKGGTPR